MYFQIHRNLIGVGYITIIVLVVANAVVIIYDTYAYVASGVPL